MARFNRTARASWPILAAVIVVAIGVWGLYAWKYAAPANPAITAAIDPPPPTANGENAPLTTLRASRPTGNALEPEQPSTNGLSSSVNVNAPSTLEGEGIEITLKNSPDKAQPGQLADRPAPPITPEGEAAAAQMRNGTLFLAKGDLVAARNAFSTALQRGLPPEQESNARRELQRIAGALLFSRAANTTDPLTGVHTVVPGDSIHAIARQHRITEELVMQINSVSEPHRLAVGQRLKVIEGPFRAVISKSRHRMDVYLGAALVRSFRVGLGTNGGTPTGSWVVRNKLPNPDWTDPRNGSHYLADDPDNPIGERWIGLEGVAGEAVGKQGFGIHGTIDPSSIGENLSMGCVRLTPDDVKFVYDLLVERHSQVEIGS